MTALVTTAVLAGLAAYTYGPAAQGVVSRLGVFRQLSTITPASAADMVLIDDTIYCEDLHYHAPTQQLFTACEDSTAIRRKWWPPLAHLDDPSLGLQGKGSLHVIDAATKQSRRLKLANFDSATPFITHGIDILPDPAEESAAIYIFAINHVPGGSRIEVFHHTLHSNVATHVRTIAHPLITTPNDILAVSPTELYVTNDHRHASGWLRMVEDVFPFARWSNLIHVVGDEENVKVARQGLHNPNGLGRGRDAGEMLLTSAMGGTLRLLRLDAVGEDSDLIQYESTVDNPFWYEDAYGGDASGFVMAGLGRPLDLENGGAGTLVWYTRKSGGDKEGGQWNTTLLWQDDGTRSGSAATAVLVGIDPAKEEGKKRAWLYVAGFQDEHIVAVKVDLD